MVDDFDVEVFYDGDCPLCSREIRGLRRLDRRERIRFTDIAGGLDSLGSSQQLPASLPLPRALLMERIHGRLPDGTMIEGVEVFRRLYAAVGFRRAVALTRLPGIKQLLNFAYRLFAKNRLRLTGRCTVGGCDVPSSARRDKIASRSGRLRIPPPAV